MARNDTTYLLNATSVTARDAELNTSGQFAGGVNLAGSNAPGIGIATGNGQCKLSDWTVRDQWVAARAAQESQHIGGTGLGSGSPGAVGVPINVQDGADVNDTVSLLVEGTGWVRNPKA